MGRLFCVSQIPRYVRRSYCGFATVRRRFYVDSKDGILEVFSIFSGLNTMDMIHLRPVSFGFMRSVLDVHDILSLFPSRKKSWAYKQLQEIKDTNAKKVVTVRDLAEYTGLTEEEVRAGMARR